MNVREWVEEKVTVKAPSASKLTSNLLQYPFLLLPSISVRTKEKVSLKTDKGQLSKGCIIHQYIRR